MRYCFFPGNIKVGRGVEDDGGKRKKDKQEAEGDAALTRRADQPLSNKSIECHGIKRCRLFLLGWYCMLTAVTGEWRGW